MFFFLKKKVREREREREREENSFEEFQNVITDHLCFSANNKSEKELDGCGDPRKGTEEAEGQVHSCDVVLTRALLCPFGLFLLRTGFLQLSRCQCAQHPQPMCKRKNTTTNQLIVNAGLLLL